MSERGIDVFERYQGAIDWAQVAASGVKHALIKLTNGANVASPAGDHYVNGAKAAGLRVGGYCYALDGDPVAEANTFADELLRLNALDDAPALDYEDGSVPQTTTAQGWIGAFFVQLRARIPSLTRVLLYSSGSTLTRIGAGAVTVPGVQIMIWDAEYSVNDGAEHPMRYYTGPVAIHQYTSAGHVPGISGAVDLDDVMTDITEEDMPTAQEIAAAVWTYPIGKRSDGSVVVAGDAEVNEYLGEYQGGGDAGALPVFPAINALVAKVDVLQATIAQVTAHPDITPEALQTMISNAFAEHVQITGTVQIGPATTPPATA